MALTESALGIVLSARFLQSRRKPLSLYRLGNPGLRVRVVSTNFSVRHPAVVTNGRHVLPVKEVFTRIRLRATQLNIE